MDCFNSVWDGICYTVEDIDSMTKDAVIVPIYKKELSELETISLNRTVQVFGGLYDIILVAPRSLDLQWYEYLFSDFGVERFDDSFFAGFAGYNRLMLSTEFYERFLAYHYILICQTDVFVFSDRLNEFCKLGYDYIGAPFALFRDGRYKLCAENGGFSLRRVVACVDLLEHFRAEARETIMLEDEFFSYYGEKAAYMFKIAPLEIAAQFAYDRYGRYLFERSGERLPFALHGWYVHGVNFNKMLVEPFLDGKISWPEQKDGEEELEELKGFFAQHDKIAFYGAGDWGKNFYEYCVHAGLPVDFFIVSDDQKLADAAYKGKKIFHISEVTGMLSDYGIVLTVSKFYRDAVKGVLLARGYSNFFDVSEELLEKIGEWLLQCG